MCALAHQGDRKGGMKMNAHLRNLARLLAAFAGVVVFAGTVTATPLPAGTTVDFTNAKAR